MTEGMLDRCAKAAADAFMEDYDEAPSLYRAVAEAVIQALNEPTRGMIEAAGRAILVYPNAKWDDPHVQRDEGGLRTATVHSVDTTWRAMIDHIRNEQSGT